MQNGECRSLSPCVLMGVSTTFPMNLMGAGQMGKENLDLLRGTFGLLLLKSISDTQKHGHEIMKWLRKVTEETFLVEEGALYPALHRLEARGSIQAKWGVTENNRRAKYYRLTAKGRRELLAEQDRWERYVATVGKVLKAKTV